MANGSLRRGEFTVVIVGPPYGTRTTGSFLRSYNIWHVIKSLRSVRVIYLPITYPVEVLLNLRHIISSDLIIVSGVSPWISAMIAFLSLLFKKRVVLDIHGSPFYEHLMAGNINIIRKALLFISEYVTYRLSSSIILASGSLINIIAIYLRVNLRSKRIYVIPNTVNYLFIKTVNRLSTMINKHALRKYILNKLGLNDSTKIILAPLPDVFVGNLLAYGVLQDFINNININNVKIIVTGISREGVINKDLITVGYLPYPEYVALLLNSHAILLPYPKNAVCGGIRNKVLEAGYCGVPIISTKNGILHINVKEWVHYIPLEGMHIKDLIKVVNDVGSRVSSNMRLLIINNYSFSNFAREILKVLRQELAGQ